MDNIHQKEASLVVLIEEVKPGIWRVTETLEDLHTGESLHQGQSLVQAETYNDVLDAYKATMQEDFPDCEYSETVAYATPTNRKAN